MSGADIQQASKEELVAENLRLRHELEQLKRLIFGSKTERFIPSTPDEQLSLPLDITPQQTAPATEEIKYSRRKASTSKPTGRLPLPAHLPRHEIILEPEGRQETMKCIGKEVTEELEYEPGKLYVNQYVRPKYIQPAEQEDQTAVLIAELPQRPVDKGIAGPGLLAQVIIDKFVDHLPVYRQAKRYEREGVRIPTSTIGNWVSATCQLLEPLYEALKEELLKEGYLQADETPLRVLDKSKKGKTHRGYHWVYYSPLKKLVLFDYRKGRGREGPTELLEGFKGYLQSDGYTVYEGFEKGAGIAVLNCMAHARRMFEQALDNDQQRAAYVLKEMQKLYALERTARENELPFQQRYELRQEKAVPTLESLEKWMKKNYAAVLPKSPIGKAISYSLSRWEKLSLYTTDGILEIDNNLVENAIRPNALGRKNYLFAGSHQAAQRSAMLYSLVGTCKKLEVNPFAWLRDVLSRIPSYPVNRIGELLPHNWKENSAKKVSSK